MLRWLATRAENKILDQIVLRPEIEFTPEEEKMIIRIYMRKRAPYTSEPNVPESHYSAEDKRLMRRTWGKDGRRNPDWEPKSEVDEGVLLANAIRELH